MSDNTTLNAGTGGDVISTDDIGGVKVQRVKVQHGVDGAAVDASATDPLPVVAALPSGASTAAKQDTGNTSLAAIDTKLGTTLSVAGSVAVVSSALPSGAATAANQATEIAGLASIDSKLAGTLAVSAAALPLPSGAATAAAQGTSNTALAAVQAAVEVLDDVVETARAKVNPIVGQAGVQGGSGAVSALTQRVVLATDVALPAGTNAIGKLSANSGVDIGDVDVTSAVITGGAIAHDAADSGNPIKVGARARTALITAVAQDDRVDALADSFGRQLVTHIDPAQQIHRAFNYTSQQTGVTIWDPTSGKRIAITSVIISAYGTTAGRVLLWFGDNGDTTYSALTDQLLLAFSAAPSSTAKPGLVYAPSVPIFCTTADRELHITSDAAMSLDVVVEGYEW